MKPIMDISLLELMECCLKDDKERETVYNHFKDTNGSYVEQAFGCRKFGYNFTDKLTLYTDGNSVIGSIRPSYDEFINSISNYLNFNYDSSLSESYVTNLLKRCVDKLESTKTENRLKESFPRINSDYVVGKRKLLKLSKAQEAGRISIRDYDSKVATDFHKCGIYRIFDNYIKAQADIYKAFVSKRKKYKNLISEKSYTEYVLDHFDPNKVALFVVYKYLEAVKDAPSDKKEELLKLVYNYVSSDYDKGVSFRLDNKVIDFGEIRREFGKFKEDRVIRVDWEIMPKSRIPSAVSRGSGTQNRRTIVLSEDEKNRLVKNGNEKNAFYANSNYVCRIVGKGKYEELIYPNGYVVKDFRFTEKDIKGTGVVYIYHVRDYESLMGLSNGSLRHHSRVIHYNHSGNWMDRVGEIINTPAIEESKKEVEKFVKTLERKKTNIN